MGQAWIAGEPASIDSAVTAAAELLRASRCPLITGLGTDVAGTRAAIILAERIGAVIDHINSEAILRDLDVMRSSGFMLTTPGEARVRADTLLLVGPGLVEAWPDLPQDILGNLRQSGSDTERRIFWLCPGHDPALPAARAKTAAIVGGAPAELPVLLAVLRARIAGRPIDKPPIASTQLDEVANALKAARFGVAVWSAAGLDALSIEMLCGMVNDLNATTRFSGLPLPCGDNAPGVLQTCGWMTGFPMRTGFGRGFPEHDPWLYDGGRLVDSGEADCVIWISSYRPLPAGLHTTPPTIALTGAGTSFATPPSVQIEVGRPGTDHSAVQYLPAAATLAAVEATQPSDRIAVADALMSIADAWSNTGAPRC